MGREIIPMKRDDGLWVAHRDDGVTVMAETFAGAREAAAAPDILTALHDCHDALCMDDNDHDAPLRAKIRAALKKAEGE